MSKFRSGILSLCVFACLAYCRVLAAANFVAYAPDHAFGVEVANKAEECRRELAIEWLGRELPPWPRPCPIRVELSNASGGVTQLEFAPGGGVIGIDMRVQGDRKTILDSIVPHEVMHTVFATYFGRALPRWADEGSCSTVEASPERLRLYRGLVKYLQTGRGIAFDEMFAMKDYPRDIMPLYAQGHSLCTFLQQHGDDKRSGRRYFVAFLADGLRNRNWPVAVESRYGYRDLGELQSAWVEWVAAGSPTPKVVALSTTEAFGGCAWQWDPLRRLWNRRRGAAQSGQGQIAQPSIPQQSTPPVAAPPPIENLPPGPSQVSTVDLSQYATKAELGQLRDELLGKVPSIQPIVDRMTQLEQDQTSLVDHTSLGQAIAKAKNELKVDLLGDHPSLQSVVDQAKQDVLTKAESTTSEAVGGLKGVVVHAAEQKAISVVNTLIAGKLAGLASAGASAGGLGALGMLGAIGGPVGIGLTIGLGLLGRAIKSGLGGAAQKQPFPIQ